MIIGVDARSLTDPQPSGVGTYCYHLVLACAQQAPADSFVVFTSGYRRQLTDQLKTLQALPNVTIRHLGLPNKVFHSLTLFNVSPTIDRVIGGCDVLFAPNLHFLPLSSKVPLVLTVHDITFALYKQFLSFRRKIWHAAVQPHRLLQRATTVIAVSETTRQDVIRHYDIPAKKITTIYSSTPSSSVPETLPNLPGNYVLAVSTIEPRKNIAALVMAFIEFTERYPGSSIDLVVIGSGGWKSASTIAQMSQHPRIHYYGYVTEGQKTYALQHATGFIYPSIYEGFGFPPLEAIQAGLPVFVSRAGALPEILNNAAYYIDPYSIEDMITVFSELDTNSQLHQELIQRAKTLLPTYDWSVTAERTLKVLHNSI